MATIRYSNEFAYFQPVDSVFTNTSLLAGWDDEGFYGYDGGYARIQGKNFKFNDTDLFAGTVTNIKVVTADGFDVYNISGIDVNIKKDLDVLAGENTDVGTLLRAAFSGNDKVIGSIGRDWLSGYGGNDVLTGSAGDDFIEGGTGRDKIKGGTGSDLFRFTPGDGKDVISDFDALSPDGVHDELYFTTDPGDITISKLGKHNTLIHYGEGDTIALLHVSKADFVEIFF